MADCETLTTLCYIENAGKYLMMHRISKKDDLNAGKWIGVGGHFKEGESPDECLLREVKEETGLTLTSYRFRGIITFVYRDDKHPCGICEYMHLYTADGFTGELSPARMRECPEGELAWIKKEEVLSLPLWEGDKIFLDLLLTKAEPFFLKLVYEGDCLLSSHLS